MAKETFELWAFQNITPSWIGCTSTCLHKRMQYINSHVSPYSTKLIPTHPPNCVSILCCSVLRCCSVLHFNSHVFTYLQCLSHPTHSIVSQFWVAVRCDVAVCCSSIHTSLSISLSLPRSRVCSLSLSVSLSLVLSLSLSAFLLPSLSLARLLSLSLPSFVPISCSCALALSLPLYFPPSFAPSLLFSLPPPLSSCLSPPSTNTNAAANVHPNTAASASEHSAVDAPVHRYAAATAVHVNASASANKYSSATASVPTAKPPRVPLGYCTRSCCSVVLYPGTAFASRVLHSLRWHLRLSRPRRSVLQCVVTLCCSALLQCVAVYPTCNCSSHTHTHFSCNSYRPLFSPQQHTQAQRTTFWTLNFPLFLQIQNTAIATPLLHTHLIHIRTRTHTHTHTQQQSTTFNISKNKRRRRSACQTQMRRQIRPHRCVGCQKVVYPVLQEYRENILTPYPPESRHRCA